jgi:ATP-dependent RNA helicase HelY
LRYQQLRTQTDALVERITRRRDTVGRTFDRVLAVLDAVDYLDGERVTPPGQRLARLYGELDLVAAECLREQLWVGLSPPDLAACVAALVYSGRHPDDAPPARLPSGRVRDVLAQMVQLWGNLAALEDDYHLDLLRPMDLGLTWAVWRWA